MSNTLEDECLKQLLPVALPIREAIAINRPFARQSFLGDIGVILVAFRGGGRLPLPRISVEAVPNR